MGNFSELKVWQRSKDLAIAIYKISNQGSFAKDYGLRDQIRRAAVSVPSNIAEGDELKTNKQSIQFFYLAKGSVAEVLTQAIISFEIGYINRDEFDQIQEECTAISSMLSKLISVRSKTQHHNRTP
jgi:four helix bundle protein